MSLPDVTKISVTCKDCQGTLSVEVDDSPSPDWGWSMTVKPCEACIATAEEGGVYAGRQRASEEFTDEISELETEVEELEREARILNRKVFDLESALASQGNHG